MSFLNHLNLTADAYWIQIKDRIVLRGNFERRSNNLIGQILDFNPEFDEIMRLAFFANSINIITKGIDIVLDGNWNNKEKSLGLTGLLLCEYGFYVVTGFVRVIQPVVIPQATGGRVQHLKFRIIDGNWSFNFTNYRGNNT